MQSQSFFKLEDALEACARARFNYVFAQDYKDNDGTFGKCFYAQILFGCGGE